MKKIAIVTGASSGIGKEFFLSLNDKASEFEEIWVIARNADKLNALKETTTTPLRVFSLDLSTKEALQTIEKTLEDETPQIAYLICASGFGRFCGVQDDERETLENMVDLNCRSIVGLTRACAPYLIKGGLVMLIASVAAFQPIPYIATYAATKAFVLNFTRALAMEMKKKGIRVMAVCPFWTKTAFFDRAIDSERDKVVKKYVAMYEPKQIVSRAIADYKKGKPVSLFGFMTKLQLLAVKIAPTGATMRIWMHQQKLK